jgi:hypothetical protein
MSAGSYRLFRFRNILSRSLTTQRWQEAEEAADIGKALRYGLSGSISEKANHWQPRKSKLGSRPGTTAASASYTSFTFLSGRLRIGLPVAAKTALSTAGATTQIVGSPTPPQKS